MKTRKHIRSKLRRKMRGGSARNSSMRGRTTRGGSAGRIFIFYHIFCNENTLDVVRDQVMKVIFSGLFEKIDKLYCFITGKKEHIQHVKAFLESLPATKLEIKEGVDDTTFERFTLNKIKDMVHANDKFLYMHSKGVTRSPENKEESANVFYWRNFMEYYLIKNYQKCLDKLVNHDVVGVAYKDILIGPHFSGNFWWSTGAYFHKLAAEHKIGDFYHDTEAFLFKAKPNASNLDKDMIPNKTFLYSTPIYPKDYMDKPIE